MPNSTEKPNANDGRDIPDWLLAIAPALMATAAGLLGSCVAAGMSAADRRANGWELGNSGKKVPPLEGGASNNGREEEKKKAKGRFSRRMAPYFLFRPFIGAAFGFFAYAALSSGTFLALPRTSQSEASPPTGLVQLLGLAAIGFLFGLFSKTLHDKLREGFKAFVDAPRDPDKKADKAQQ